MQLRLHQTHNTIGDFSQIFTDLKSELGNLQENEASLSIYPELYLCGYPLQDLVLQKEFIDSYQKALNELSEFTKKLPESKSVILAGGIEYQLNDYGLPQKIYNVIYQIRPAKELKVLYRKRLLPSYDIFDEQKYFSSGTEKGTFQFNGLNIALLLCEDMWHSNVYDIDPVTELIDSKENFDLILNLSASPYHLGKGKKRLERAKEISTLLKAPFAYVNRIGFEDEIIFDGGSFVLDGDKVVKTATTFEKHILEYQFEKSSDTDYPNIKNETSNTWESLFSPNIGTEFPPRLAPLRDLDCEEIIEAISFSIIEYANKCKFEKFLVALSGGIDSSLVLALLYLSGIKKENIEAIFMPGQFTDTISFELSEGLCENLQVKLSHFPIKFPHAMARNAFEHQLRTKLEGLADENIQSRLRGTFLYAKSNLDGSMVLNTSNKSELAVGYSTLYGDSVGSISPLGDLYKSEVFALARYINKTYNGLIPEGIVERPPSAELREDQKDSDSLPPYDRLDPMLEGLLSFRYSREDLIQCGFDSEEVEQTFRLWNRSEFKRKQFCPIIKLKSKSFGFGYRVPICKKY